MDDCESERPSPGDVFGVLSDELRLALLYELADAKRNDEYPVPFSALERTFEVDSGRLGYHLRQLTGRFVAHGDVGYSLTHAGWRAVRAIRAGTFSEGSNREWTTIDSNCPHCDRPDLQLRYADEVLSIECAGCEAHLVEQGVPPGIVVGRETEMLCSVIDQWTRHRLSLAHSGICPDCSGRLDAELTTGVRDEADVLVSYDCSVCGEWILTRVGTIAALDEDVSVLLDDHGLAIEAVPYWTLPQWVSDRYTTIESTDPWRFVVEFPVGEGVSVVIDDTLSIIDGRTGVPVE